MSEKLHLYQAMTREEFQLCWALRMTLGFESFDNAYPLDAYPTPGTREFADTYDEQMKRAIRFLALDGNFTFQGLSVYEDGRIEGVPIEPRNILYARGIATGNFPHPIACCQAGIRLLEERGSKVSTEPLHQLIREIEAALDEIPDPDVEELAEYENEKRKALAVLGIERQRGAVH